MPGKVTLFDFYAVWCAPCRKIDAHVFAPAGQAQRPGPAQAQRGQLGDAAGRALPEEHPEPALRGGLREGRQAGRRPSPASIWPRWIGRSPRRPPDESGAGPGAGRAGRLRAAPPGGGLRRLPQSQPAHHPPVHGAARPGRGPRQRGAERHHAERRARGGLRGSGRLPRGAGAAPLPARPGHLPRRAARGRGGGAHAAPGASRRRCPSGSREPASDTRT